MDGGDWAVKDGDQFVSVSLVDLLNFIHDQGYNGTETNIMVVSDCNYSGNWAASANQNWTEGQNYSQKFHNLSVQGSTSQEKMAEWNAYRHSQMEGDTVGASSAEQKMALNQYTVKFGLDIFANQNVPIFQRLK